MLTPDKPTPTAEELEDAQALPWTILDRLIARFEETAANADRAEELALVDERLGKWAELEVNLAVDARCALTEAIILSSPHFEVQPVRTCDRFRRPALGVRSNGKVYLVHPDPEQDGQAEGYDKPPIMKLVVFAGDAVVDMESASQFAAVVPGPIKPRSAEVAPVKSDQPRWSAIHALDPTTPVWMLTVLKAAEDLGEREAIRRILDSPRKPGA